MQTTNIHLPKFFDNDIKINHETDKILEQISLSKFAKEDAGLLSYADQRALEIGITIAGGAETILLDEPTAGMSKSETDRATNLIRSISKNRTIVIVEHDMGVVFDLSDTISVLVYGQIICSDTPINVKNDNKVKEAYLGNFEAENDKKITNLNSYYGKSHILQGVNLNVHEGEIVSLLGRNGVGRSTFIKSIMGMVKAEGSILTNNNEILGRPVHEIANLGIGYVSENRDIFLT